MKRSVATGLVALVVGLGLAWSAPAAEQGRYIYFGVTPGHKLGGFFDRTSLTRDGDKGVAALIGVFPADDGSGPAYFTLKSAYDCKAVTSRNLSGAFYAADGSVIEERNEPETQWFPVASADPVDSAMHRVACEGSLPAGARTFNSVEEAVAWYRGGGR